jgi:hypothetical protein
MERMKVYFFPLIMHQTQLLVEISVNKVLIFSLKCVMGICNHVPQRLLVCLSFLLSMGSATQTVTNLINVLPGNSSVNMFQRAKMEAVSQ